MAEHEMTPEEKERWNVYCEIIEAEKSYIKAMKYVLFYEDELENTSDLPVLRTEASPLINNQAAVIFANVRDILNFHSSKLLPQLEKCKDDPISVGQIFMNNSRNFVQFYTPYVQNYQAQSALAIEIGKNDFFTQCDRKRGEATGLPYTAYLLFPVQRIAGKYGLLIKEMLKSSTSTEDEKRLEDCLKTLKSVATTVNGVSFSPLILNYPGKLYEEGELILHAKFSVVYKSKKEDITMFRKMKSKIKPTMRLICFYDKYIIFCKERKPSNPATGKMYEYKNRFESGHFGITENLKDEPKKFELWTDGQEEVYTITVKNLGMKEHWVNTIAARLCRHHRYTENDVDIDETSPRRCTIS